MESITEGGAKSKVKGRAEGAKDAIHGATAAAVPTGSALRHPKLKLAVSIPVESSERTTKTRTVP
jgi:hypothetical protein